MHVFCVLHLRLLHKLKSTPAAAGNDRSEAQSPPWRLRWQLMVLNCAGSTPLQGPGSMHHQQEKEPTLVLQPVNPGSAGRATVLGSNPCSSSNSRQHPPWRRETRVCGQPSCAGDVTHVTAAGGKTYLGAAACGSALCRQSYRTGDPAGCHAHENAAECCHCHLAHAQSGKAAWAPQRWCRAQAPLEV